MLRSHLLAIGPIFTVDVIGLVEKMVGAIQIHQPLLSRRSLPFSPLSHFSPSPSHLLASATQAIIVSKDMVQIPGGRVLLGILGWRVPPSSPNPDPISDQKKCNLPHPVSDQTSKIHARFQTWPLSRNFVIIT